MQEQFKDRILEYLVGDYTTENPNENLVVSQAEDLTSSIYEDLEELTDYYIYGVTNDQNNNYIIIYGYYDTNKGFIAMANYDFQTISIFTTYEGGTTLPIIKYLTYADDGTFYGISEQNNNQYMLMLNNFTLTLTGTYSIKFRQSYLLNGNLQNAVFDIKGAKIFKKIENAEYIFVAPLTTTSTSITSVIVSTLEVNVGEENEWTHTTYSTNIYFNQILNTFNGFETFASWVDDDYYVKFGGMTPNSTYIEYKCVNSGAVSSYTSTFDSGLLYLQAHGGIAMPTYNATYIGTTIRNTDPATYNIWKVNNNEELIYSVEDEIPSGTSSYFILKMNNNRIIFAGNGTGKLGIVINDKGYEIGNVGLVYEESEIFVTSQFNLNNIYVYDSAYIQKYILIYNQNNYIGQDYKSYESMIPNSGIIYNDDSKIVFARNLYNKIINSNTTESILEIPNTYLNDITLSKQYLISKTNSILNENTQQINKNIYETVYLNFFNTLNISNKNDPTNEIINQIGASKLNQSISNLADYNNSSIGIIRINYDDNTSRDITSYGLIQNNTSSYTFSFNIYVPKYILNIQFLSKDGTTIYHELTPTLEIGKYYKIAQDVKIV